MRSLSSLTVAQVQSIASALSNGRGVEGGGNEDDSFFGSVLSQPILMTLAGTVAFTAAFVVQLKRKWPKSRAPKLEIEID
jgi:hypothetical protein